MYDTSNLDRKIDQCTDKHRPKLTPQKVLITCGKHPSVQIGIKHLVSR